MLFETMYNSFGSSVGPLILLAISAIMALHYLIEVPPHIVSESIIKEMDRVSKSQEDFDNRLSIYTKEIANYYTKANFWIIMGKTAAVVIVVINFVEVCILK